MTIIVGFVDKPEARRALARATEEAQLRSMKLVIVNAVRGESPIESAASSLDDLQDIARGLESEGLEVEVVQPLEPDYSKALVDEADRREADMIVIGLRKRSPVGKLFLGSTAQQILLHANCPVLAVKS